MKKSLVSLLVGLSIGSSFAVNAAEEERWFEVEVILFERNLDPAKVMEHWDQSVYPTYSKNNTNPMQRFTDNKNLISASGQDNLDNTALSNQSATSTTDLQPTLIDDSDTLPVYGSDQDNNAFSDANDESNIIRATPVVIDGANLKTEVKTLSMPILAASELQLNEQFTALNEHANYNVVMHAGWRMQPKNRKNAIPIRLFAGQNYQQQYKLNGDPIIKVPATVTTTAIDASDGGPDSINATTASNAVDTTSISSNAPEQESIPGSDTKIVIPELVAKPVWKIDGELTIYLEHYLYAKTDLFVRKEGSKTITDEQTSATELADTEVMRDANDIDLLKRLGIHLEPKQANYSDLVVVNEQDATSATADAEAVKTDGKVDTEVEADVESVLNTEAAAKANIPFLNSYPMQQLRVIRSGEIHYIDHPMFGMLIQIRKYNPE